MVEASTSATGDTGPGEAVSGGPVQQPDAAAVASLSAESRANIARELGWRYPLQKAQIDEWYQQTPPPPATTLAEQLGQGGFAPASEGGSEIDLLDAERMLEHNVGHSFAEVKEFTADLKSNLAATGLDARIAASVGEELIRGSLAYQSDPAAGEARYFNEVKPLVQRIAKNVDGSPATWDQVKAGLAKAVEKLDPEFRAELVQSGALPNSAAAILQLFNHGQRLVAQEKMRSGK